MAKNGTPVLIKDLGTVSFGPDMREGVAEWNGEGETVGGIVVMRYGVNALNVIDGVKKKLAEIKGSLPPGVEIVSGYDRGGLIRESINTLKHSLIEEAIIVSLVIIVFLFHFRSALIPARTSCRWAAWHWRLAFWWTPPSSWWRTDTGIFPSVRHQREKHSTR